MTLGLALEKKNTAGMSEKMNKPSNRKGTDSMNSRAEPATRKIDRPVRTPKRASATPTKIPPWISASPKTACGKVSEMAPTEEQDPPGEMETELPPLDPQIIHGLTTFMKVLVRVNIAISRIGITKAKESKTSFALGKGSRMMTTYLSR